MGQEGGRETGEGQHERWDSDTGRGSVTCRGQRPRRGGISTGGGQCHRKGAVRHAGGSGIGGQKCHLRIKNLLSTWEGEQAGQWTDVVVISEESNPFVGTQAGSHQRSSGLSKQWTL